jgi:hypothetical protein
VFLQSALLKVIQDHAEEGFACKTESRIDVAQGIIISDLGNA